MKYSKDSKDLDNVNNKQYGSFCRNIDDCENSLSESSKEKTIKGLVSIIIPVYNTEATLLTLCIESLKRQTYENIEIIMIDDGSNMECARLCDVLKKSDNRIQVFHVNNSGVSAARNYGIEHGRGEYVVFVDSDDTMPMNSIEEMMNYINMADYVICGCKHLQKHDQDIKIDKVLGNEAINKDECIRYLCYMNPRFKQIETNAIWGKMYRKELLKDIRFSERMVMAEDFKFNFDYIGKIKQGIFLNNIGYNYLVRKESISRKYNPKMVETIRCLDSLIIANENSSSIGALKSRCVNIAFTIFMLLPDGMDREEKLIKQFINRYRLDVLLNKYSKHKVKAAVLLSCFSYRLTKIIYKKLQGSSYD